MWGDHQHRHLEKSNFFEKKSAKSKNRSNFWSFWSYTFIFGEDGTYFIYKIRKTIFLWKNIFFDPKNINSEKIFFQILKISKSKFQNIKISKSYIFWIFKISNFQKSQKFWDFLKFCDFWKFINFFRKNIFWPNLFYFKHMIE